MKLRPAPFLLPALLVLGCGGDAGESEAVVEETAEREMSAEEAGMAAIRCRTTSRSPSVR